MSSVASRMSRTGKWEQHQKKKCFFHRAKKTKIKIFIFFALAQKTKRPALQQQPDLYLEPKWLRYLLILHLNDNSCRHLSKDPSQRPLKMLRRYRVTCNCTDTESPAAATKIAITLKDSETAGASTTIPLTTVRSSWNWWIESS